MGVIEIVKRQERQQGLQRGLQQGAEQKSYEFITNLIGQTDFDDARIASLAGVGVSFVKKVRTDLTKKNKG